MFLIFLFLICCFYIISSKVYDHHILSYSGIKEKLHPLPVQVSVSIEILSSCWPQNCTDSPHISIETHEVKSMPTKGWIGTRVESISTGIKKEFHIFKFPQYTHLDYKYYANWNDSASRNISISYSPLPENHTVVIITASKKRISRKLSNTMRLLSLYAKVFNIRPVIITNSSAISNYAKSLHFNLIPPTEENQYGMPILRSLLIETRNTFKAKQYFYINSDILLNPGIFFISKFLHDYFGCNQYLLASTVYNTPVVPKNLSFTSLNKFRSSFSSLYGTRRSIYAIDIFIFPFNFPFESLSPVVVGRWHIDYAILYFTHRRKFPVVDLTFIKSAHQGTKSAYKKVSTLSEKDFKWNFQFFNKSDSDSDGSLASNYLVA